MHANHFLQYMNIQPKYVLLLLAFWGGLLQAQTIKTEDLYIRDPYVLVDEEKGIYYLYRHKFTIFVIQTLAQKTTLQI